MYLSDRQIHALQMALEAMNYRNSGELDDEQSQAYDTISKMIDSALKSKRKQKH